MPQRHRLVRSPRRPYTAKTISYKRGTETSDAVQIDHVLPLAYVWAHGGTNGAPQATVANDPLNLLAVDGSSNQAKGACSQPTCPSGDSAKGTWNPSNSRSWWPENSNYSCNYARRFVSVASAYHMGLPPKQTKTTYPKSSPTAATTAPPPPAT